MSARRKRRTRRKPKNKKLQYTLYVLCLIMILAGWWSSCSASKENETQHTHDIPVVSDIVNAEALMKVGIPDSVPSEPVEYTGFTMSFNPNAHVPNWVAWELTAEETKGHLSRSKKFRTDYRVDGCAEQSDYKNSGFDRGHMCPAGDMKWSEDAMSDCFLFTNMCPQAKELNSGAWKSLEEKSRVWAQRDSALIIVCGPVLSDYLTKSIGATGVIVPQRFFKVILAPYSDPPRAIGFIMNNGRVEGGMQQAAVSVDEVERITGFDFFSALPDDIEIAVESQNNFAQWSRLK